ncbi:response regulator [Pseudenhygromyxa sp. WMMC2535]|uniref:response regulator n=1 Tax=Pseudenhygromyxa sp. WMMC2535 TaxID=2712867 RepID=UPI00155429F9|nr:response regulator [Pseudenhygromyxa sp. WMMC2535]
MSDRRPILVVEDNDANYALIHRLLESTGLWTVSRATEVAQALTEIARQRPEVILLDIDLPGDADGLVLARTIKGSEELRRIPIVVVSASVMKQEHAKAAEAGCEYFVEKPFDIDKLRRVVVEAASV